MPPKKVKCHFGGGCLDWVKGNTKNMTFLKAVFNRSVEGKTQNKLMLQKFFLLKNPPEGDTRHSTRGAKTWL